MKRNSGFAELGSGVETFDVVRGGSGETKCGDGRMTGLEGVMEKNKGNEERRCYGSGFVMVHEVPSN